MYTETGRRGRPPKNLILHADVFFCQAAHDLTDEETTDDETATELQKNKSLRMALGAENWSVCERTIWDFRNRAVCHLKIGAVFNPFTDSFFKKYAPDFTSIRFDNTRIRSDMKKNNFSQLISAASRNFVSELENSCSTLHAELSDELMRRYGAGKNENRSFALKIRKFGTETEYMKEDDLCFPVRRFRDVTGNSGLKSCSVAARVFGEQRTVISGKNDRGLGVRDARGEAKEGEGGFDRRHAEPVRSRCLPGYGDPSDSWAPAYSCALAAPDSSAESRDRPDSADLREPGHLTDVATSREPRSFPDSSAPAHPGTHADSDSAADPRHFLDAGVSAIRKATPMPESHTIPLTSCLTIPPDLPEDDPPDLPDDDPPDLPDDDPPDLPDDEPPDLPDDFTDERRVG
jgi:hypothetical protein